MKIVSNNVVEVWYKKIKWSSGKDILYFGVRFGERFYYKKIYYNASKLKNPRRLFIRLRKQEYMNTLLYESSDYKTFFITKEECERCFPRISNPRLNDIIKISSRGHVNVLC